ncbi:MAG: TraI/MobA(P) family conjugative relaxase [Alphaproteobacteria bacterium]
MIAKSIKRTTNSGFKRLANYIAGAEDEGEKLDSFWIVNSIAGESLDDLEIAIIDIENTQSKNLKATSDKTYHLLVSFRNEKPKLEELKDIECEFAKALEFEKHQRVVGTHQNTDNFHMHIAYSKVNPETGKINTPYYDYAKLSKVCRAMEKKYNLAIDNGFEKTKEPDYKKPHEKARDFEAKTWQQSFYSYVKEQKEPLTKALDKSQKWQDLHNAFEEVGLLLKKRGNGLAIVSINNKVAIKVSDLDRSFSKNSLEKKLGNFEESNREIEPKTTYTEKPLTKHPNTEILWQKYQEVKKKPKEKAKEQSLLKKAFYTWKDFLMAEATKDPFAMAVIAYQKKLINAVTPKFDRKPIAEPKPKPQEKERYIVEIPNDCKKASLIEKTAKFDKEENLYYLEKDVALKFNINMIKYYGGKVISPEEQAQNLKSEPPKTPEQTLETPAPQAEPPKEEKPKKDTKSQDWGMGFGM